MCLQIPFVQRLKETDQRGDGGLIQFFHSGICILLSGNWQVI
jgi:hypothetical protein